MPPTLTPLGSRIAGAVLGALLDPAVPGVCKGESIGKP